MLTQTDARIFLREERGMFQSTGYKSLRTFHFEEYKREGREVPGTLRAFNDDTLAADAAHVIEVNELCEIILLPIAGAIEISIEGPQYIDSGQAVRFWAVPGKQYVVTNPYRRESVNYLEMHISANIFSEETEIDCFEILQRDAFSYLFSKSRQRLAIGIFGGREEGIFLPEHTSNVIIAFVIEGAFEIQNRLLERRDALVLQHVESVDFEALSNEAILLVMEVPG